MEDKLNNDERYKEKYSRKMKKCVLSNVIRKLSIFIRDLKKKHK